MVSVKNTGLGGGGGRRGKKKELRWQELTINLKIFDGHKQTPRGVVLAGKLLEVEGFPEVSTGAAICKEVVVERVELVWVRKTDVGVEEREARD